MGAGVGASEGAQDGASESHHFHEGTLRLEKTPGGRSVPTTGMRGGLGRTLLTAFLILAILPIAVTGGYAARQNRRNAEQDAGSRLVAVAALKGALLRHRVSTFTAQLVPEFVGEPGSRRDSHQVSRDLAMPALEASGSVYARWWVDVAASIPREGKPWLSGCAVLDRQGGAPLWVSGVCSELDLHAPHALSNALASSELLSDGAPRLAQFQLMSPGSPPYAGQTPSEGQTRSEGPIPLLVLSLPDRVLILCLTDDAVRELLESELDEVEFGMGKTGRTSLVGDAGVWSEGGVPDGWGPERQTVQPGWDAASPPGEVGPGHAPYQKSNGDWVVAAFFPLPEYGLSVRVEQAQAEVLAGTERVAATLIAWILAVALGTTWTAAAVIRQITRPVIDLTESAVAMAEGDLDQRLPVRSRDEIGILTHVFNGMSAELSSLYRDLELKVVERTRRLQEANYQIQRRALYLQASQEVSQAITSVRDPGVLLAQVTELVRNHFVYSSVAVYLVEPGGGEARLHASSPPESPGPRGTDSAQSRSFEAAGEGSVWPSRYYAGDGSVVGRAIRKGNAQLDNSPVEPRDGWTSLVLSRAAVPMRIAGLKVWSGGTPDAEPMSGAGLDRPDPHAPTVPGCGGADSFGVVGALAVVTTAHEGIQRDELEVLGTLANQVTIALENARAYERERLAVEQLGLAEAFKARFLANMSRELMEPLNTILGFSRLLLKGIDGSLNERQREDLTQIHGDGQHLRVLINDILSISELQAGLVELRLQPVNVAELVAGIMPTAGALVRGKGITLDIEIPADLPEVRGDPVRLRQVLVHLLNNAAKFTEAGGITIRAWANDGEVFVSVSDTGMGIAPGERSRLFMHLGAKDIATDGPYRRGIGLGLSFCREFVELHGGRIWVDSEMKVGSVITFSLPIDRVI
jgi:signal transduction histidine kinase/HAMP domain-containing protein